MHCARGLPRPNAADRQTSRDHAPPLGFTVHEVGGAASLKSQSNLANYGGRRLNESLVLEQG